MKAELSRQVLFLKFYFEQRIAGKGNELMPLFINLRVRVITEIILRISAFYLVPLSHIVEREGRLVWPLNALNAANKIHGS